jgi:hypothetical protein
LFGKTPHQIPSPFRAEVHPGFSIRLVVSHVAKTRHFLFRCRENAPSEDCARKLKHAIKPDPSEINPESSSQIADLATRNCLNVQQKSRMEPSAGPAGSGRSRSRD